VAVVRQSCSFGIRVGWRRVRGQGRYKSGPISRVFMAEAAGMTMAPGVRAGQV
jgi:hypothetical protein